MITQTNRLFSFKNEQEINTRILYYESLPNPLDKYRKEAVSGALAYRYQGDFYGLLDHFKIEPEFYFASLYLNGLTSPYEFDGKECIIKIALPINLPI